MVLGYHVIFTAYGFWLPNDPRGSWSDFVGSWELLRFGRATKTTTRKSVARQRHDSATRLAAKKALKYPAVQFTGPQARAIGIAFGKFVRRSEITVWACSILPEHVHMVIGRHDYEVEQIVNLLKGAATSQLIDDKLHPLARFGLSDSRPPKCWAKGQWKVFLDNEERIRGSIRYVEENPIKEGKPLQHWSFVTPFDSV
jgi:REP element-mobilizing transposase RayT